MPNASQRHQRNFAAARSLYGPPREEKPTAKNPLQRIRRNQRNFAATLIPARRAYLFCPGGALGRRPQRPGIHAREFGSESGEISLIAGHMTQETKEIEAKPPRLSVREDGCPSERGNSFPRRATSEKCINKSQPAYQTTETMTNRLNSAFYPNKTEK